MLVITDLANSKQTSVQERQFVMSELWSQQDRKWDCGKCSEGGCAGCRWLQQREALLRNEHTETYIKERAEWTRPGPADPVIQKRAQETSRAKWLKPSGKNSPLGSLERLGQLGCVVTCYSGKRFAFWSGYHREALSIFCCLVCLFLHKYVYVVYMYVGTCVLWCMCGGLKLILGFFSELFLGRSPCCSWNSTSWLVWLVSLLHGSLVSTSCMLGFQVPLLRLPHCLAS